MADWVKGKAYEKYPIKIQQGIHLHRSIDNFTDTHPIVMQSKTYFRATYGKYAGVITDIVYDHFLAKNWSNFGKEDLQTYSNRTFRELLANLTVMPIEVKMVLPKMIASNRLVSYNSLLGIQKVLEIMSSHTSLPSYTNQAMAILEQNYEQLHEEFNAFIPQAEAYLYNKYVDLWEVNHYKK